MILHHTFTKESAMRNFAARLASFVTGRAIIFLHGPLGAGKTTFTRGFLQGLGYQGKVKSPTYTLVEPYEISGTKIFHFDFYRLQTANELSYIGIEDYFAEPAICLIEWPELGLGYLPQADLSFTISIAVSGRIVCMNAHTELGDNLMRRLK
jgi:tRNA threonylcarbamoyladenosine biosynthesis protein TsaE